MTHRRSIFPAAPQPDRLLLDARLHLLDRQIIDTNGDPIGIVDDLDLAFEGTRPRVTAIRTGQLLTTRILGGRPPLSRLHAIPWRFVAKIGTVVQLCAEAETDTCLWAEHWLRDHVVGRIPGGRHVAK